MLGAWADVGDGEVAAGGVETAPGLPATDAGVETATELLATEERRTSMMVGGVVATVENTTGVSGPLTLTPVGALPHADSTSDDAANPMAAEIRPAITLPRSSMTKAGQNTGPYYSRMKSG